MTDQELQIIFENYLNAFADPDPTAQERLLRSSVADDVVFTNPGGRPRRGQSLGPHRQVSTKVSGWIFPNPLVPAAARADALGVDPVQPGRFRVSHGT